MASIITMGVEYAQLLADLRATIRHEVTQALSTNVAPVAEVGGMALAKEITGLSESRIYALVSIRQLPHSKRGNKLYFNRADLLAWVKVGDRIEKEVAYA
jgi:predicted DNA-binding transcriptional regulator AlpA